MKLHSTITSGYTRKVWVVAHETGLVDRIERIPTNPHVDEYLRHHNPLCRIPTLVLDDGDTLFDSPVICEYLDSRSETRKLFPAKGPARWRALKLQALGDGLLDANTARRAELMRPKSTQSVEAIAHRTLAIKAGYEWLENHIDHLQLDEITIGDISIACALGWSQLAFPDERWEEPLQRLAAWHAEFERRPSMRATHYSTLKQKLLPSDVKEGPAARPVGDVTPIMFSHETDRLS